MLYFPGLAWQQHGYADRVPAFKLKCSMAGEWTGWPDDGSQALFCHICVLSQKTREEARRRYFHKKSYYFRQRPSDS